MKTFLNFNGGLWLSEASSGRFELTGAESESKEPIKAKTPDIAEVSYASSDAIKLLVRVGTVSANLSLCGFPTNARRPARHEDLSRPLIASGGAFPAHWQGRRRASTCRAFQTTHV